MPTERERLRTTFESAASRYHDARPDYPAELYDELVQRACLRTGDPLLEVGCGTGRATLNLAKRGFRITCVELGERLATQARHNNANSQRLQRISRPQTGRPGTGGSARPGVPSNHRSPLRANRGGAMARRSRCLAFAMAFSLLAAGCASTSASRPAGGLSGFGATRKAWEAKRGPMFNVGYASAYGKWVRDADMHEFEEVTFSPRVSSYFRGFPRSSFGHAEQVVLGDFPGDARITTVDRTNRRCWIVLVESERLANVTGDWARAAFYSSRDRFDPDKVVFAGVDSHAAQRTPGLGNCG